MQAVAEVQVVQSTPQSRVNLKYTFALFIVLESAGGTRANAVGLVKEEVRLARSAGRRVTAGRTIGGTL